MKDYRLCNKEQFEKKLLKKFKFLYRYLFTDGFYGIECNRGWYNLIWLLSTEIMKILKKRAPSFKKYNSVVNTKKEKVVINTRFKWLALVITKLSKNYIYRDDCLFVGQVKEKFGMLRFYVRNCEIEPILKEIKEATEASETICEVCGDNTGTSNLKGDNWVYNMCESCWASHNKNKIYQVSVEDEEKLY